MRNTLIKIASLLLLFVIITIKPVLSQNLSEEYETMLLEEEENTEGLAFKPVIGAGLGSFTFFGDVNDYDRNPLRGLTSFRVAISRNIGKYFDIEFQGTFGNVTGNEYNGDADKTLNFKSNLFLGGVSMYYNFNHILKRQRPIHPYISLGVEILQFTPKADLLDADDNQYHYWTDATIHSVNQNVNNGGVLLARDYDYESDLRKLDLYGYGYYPTTSFAIPIDVGLNVTVSDRVKCRLGAAFHFSWTDYIDNYKAENVFYNNDIILNTYVSLSIDLFSSADELTAVENFKNLKFTITDREDEDGDRVDDFNDECPNTPKGVKVNFKGCPEDTDKDGVPDYMDKQNDTPLEAVGVGANGISLGEAQLIVLLYDPDAVKRSEIRLYSKDTKLKQTKNTKGIPDKFKFVDLNQDNYISHEELQKAIDAFFDGTSPLTPKDVEELQEFFFNQ